MAKRENWAEIADRIEPDGDALREEIDRLRDECDELRALLRDVRGRLSDIQQGMSARAELDAGATGMGVNILRERALTPPMVLRMIADLLARLAALEGRDA